MSAARISANRAPQPGEEAEIVAAAVSLSTWTHSMLLFSVLDDWLKRIAVARIAGKCLSAPHELAAGNPCIVARDLSAELVGGAALCLCRCTRPRGHGRNKAPAALTVLEAIRLARILRPVE
jgi:hypothetical protein